MTTSAPGLSILLLCHDGARHTGTVDSHVRAFKAFSRHKVAIADSFGCSRLDFDLSGFDLVVFHYSIVISLDTYLPPAFAERLARFAGPKILFIQDEFRWIDRTCAAIERLGIRTVFTVVNPDVVRKIYRTPWFDQVRFEHTLTGFVPEHVLGRPVPAYRDRPIDVSYRARKLPAWCGSFAQQKWRIGERFLADAGRYGLVCDIAMSEASRIYGEKWLDFVADSKAVLGTESGASFLDYTGEVYQAVDRYEAAHPEASFEEVADKLLEGRDGEAVIHVISPRVFEAAALRSLMILYPGVEPGAYSGAIEPWRHYVPLAPDHSNMDEVVAVLRDTERSGAIIARAHDEVAQSERWTHKAFVAHFDRVAGELHDAADAGAGARASRKGLWQATGWRAGQGLGEWVEREAARGAHPRGALRHVIGWAYATASFAARLIRRLLPERLANRLIELFSRLLRRMKPLLRLVFLGHR
jgi:hypothetical protein